MSKEHKLSEWANVTAIACDVPECENVIRVTPASQPAYWGRLTVALRNGKETVERDLCPECSTAIMALLNSYRRYKPKDSGWGVTPKNEWQ